MSLEYKNPIFVLRTEPKTFENRTPLFVHSVSDIKNFMRRNLNKEMILCFLSKMNQKSVNFYHEMYVEQTIDQTNRVCAIIDIDASPELALLFKVTTAPTFVFYKQIAMKLVETKRLNDYTPKTFI
jgi:thioredoxin-related protein